MNTKKAIITLLIIVIVLSILTTVFSLLSSNGTFADKSRDNRANAGFAIEDNSASKSSSASVNFYIEGGK